MKITLFTGEFLTWSLLSLDLFCVSLNESAPLRVLCKPFLPWICPFMASKVVSSIPFFAGARRISLCLAFPGPQLWRL